MKYYIDLESGCGDGHSPESARADYKDLPLQAGDEVLFKRGSFIRDILYTTEGVTYAAYGEGEKPAFCGSIDVSSPSDWKQAGNNIWECIHPTYTEACNFVFNGGKSCGALKWTKDEFSQQGDWCDNRFGYGGKNITGAEQHLYMYSEKNPGEYYDHIECAVYGKRTLGECKPGVNIENLKFTLSGVHAFNGTGKNNVIKNCDFSFIGGCVWEKDLKIRYGNALEFWDIAQNVTVTGCTFDNIYDSCITTQGSEKMQPVYDVDFSGNIFNNYGMAAYELRDVLPINARFCNNVCNDAGRGFAEAGVIQPRRSEIWPEPMGHHIFIWRVDKPTPGGKVEIKENVFNNAPYGAAIYSNAAYEAEQQFDIDKNVYYTENKSLLNKWNGKYYSSFEEYVNASGLDKNGCCKLKQED